MRAAVVIAVLEVLAWTALAAGPGRVYVYAQRPSEARSWTPIVCGGHVVAELKQGTFFAMDLAPGRYTVGTTMGVPAFVDVRSGEEAFLRLGWNYQVGRPPISVMESVRPEQAHEEMKYLSYIKAGKVLSHSVAATDPRSPEPLQLKRRPPQ